MNEDPKKLYNNASGSLAANKNNAVIHVRVEGRSRDIAIDLLDISPDSSDEKVKEVVARFMELSGAAVKTCVVERHENGNMTLRPEAVFG